MKNVEIYVVKEKKDIKVIPYVILMTTIFGVLSYLAINMESIMW